MSGNIIEARINYFRRRIPNLTGSAVWSELRNLGLVKESQHSALVVSTDELNQFFTSNSSITSTIINNYSNILTLTAMRKIRQSIDFRLITFDTVQKALLSIKSNAIGVDNISKKMIVPIIHLVLDTSTCLFNESLNTSIFPES